LKAHNVAFWLVAPTLVSKYYFDCHIHDRVDNLWRIHTNRVNKGNFPHNLIEIGLDGTYKKSGIYNDKMQDNN
jgi:hypothetical protein